MKFQDKIIFWTREIWWMPSWADIDENEAIELLKYAYSKWLRIFDTAPIYWFWKSEILLWKALWDVRNNIKIISKFWIQRDKKTLETKFCYDWNSIKNELKESLERIWTSYIDIYLLHIPNWYINVEEVINTLEELKKEWKILHYWLSNCYNELLKEFLEKWNIEYLEDFYNLFDRKIENIIFPYITDKQKILAYSPLYRWVLSDSDIKYLISKNCNAINRMIKNNNLPNIIKKKKMFHISANKKWISLAELAYMWLFKNNNISSIIIWTTKKENIDFAINIFKKYYK